MKWEKTNTSEQFDYFFWFTDNNIYEISIRMHGDIFEYKNGSTADSS